MTFSLISLGFLDDPSDVQIFVFMNPSCWIHLESMIEARRVKTIHQDVRMYVHTTGLSKLYSSELH